MRILYDHQIFVAQKFGGISRYYSEIMKLGDENIKISSIDPEFFTPKPLEFNTDLISRGSRFIKRKIGITNQKQVTQFPENVVDLLTNGDFDVFHPTYYDPYFFDHTNKPFVLTVYDMIHEIYKEYFSLSDRTSQNKLLLCHKANQIIAISQKTKDDLLNLFNISEQKVHVIPLASNFHNVEPVEPKNSKSLKKYILFVGTRHIYKNFYFPLYALSELLKVDEHLQVLCTGHPFTNDELQFFKDLGVQDQVKHIYPHNDNELAWLYRNAALFIFPSLYEGFGFPMLEAFASGCPVISSTGGSLPEVGGDAALYFDPKCKIGIQEAAHKVLYSDSVRADLIAKGNLQYQKFSWRKCREETLSIYKKVLN